jgi:hypothetical protein
MLLRQPTFRLNERAGFPADILRGLRRETIRETMALKSGQCLRLQGKSAFARRTAGENRLVLTISWLHESPFQPGWRVFCVCFIRATL